jgi:hypothetical protein
VRQSAVALLRVTRGADFCGRLLFPLLYTLSDYAIDTDSLRNSGTAQLLRFRILEASLLPVQSSAAANGQTLTRRDDQIAVTAQMRDIG